MGSHLLFAFIEMKAIANVPDGIASFETRKSRMLHESDTCNDRICYGTCSEKGANAHLLEGVIEFRVPHSTRIEQLRHLVAQLEVCALEFHVLSGRDLQDEPEIDVHEMALGVDEDVAVVSILALQQKTGDGIACFGNHEVVPSGFESRRPRRPEFPLKDLVQTAIRRLTQGRSRFAVRHHFDDTCHRRSSSCSSDGHMQEVIPFSYPVGITP